jgi:hypothetical protein
MLFRMGKPASEGKPQIVAKTPHGIADCCTHNIDESGLRETIGEIVSVVPWTAVKAYIHVEKRVFIELTEGLWAIIPQNSVTQDSDRVEDLLSRLREHGVANRTAEIALRHAH